MKKTLSILAAALLMSFVFASVASAQEEGMGDFKGKMFVGGFFNYGFGFGDAFKDFEYTDPEFDVTFKQETNLSFSFGGRFFYGLAPKVGVGAVVDYQTIKFKGSVSGTDVPAEIAQLFEYDETENWISINGNVIFFFSPEKKFCPYFEGGPGFYIPSSEGSDSKFGVNGGVGGMYMTSPNMGLDFGGRFHIIFTEGESTTYVEAHAGVNFFFGGAQ